MCRNDGDLASRTRVPVLTRADGNYFLIGGLELDQGIRALVQDVVADLRTNGEPLPTPLAEWSN